LDQIQIGFGLNHIRIKFGLVSDRFRIESYSDQIRIGFGSNLNIRIGFGLNSDHIRIGFGSDQIESERIKSDQIILYKIRIKSDLSQIRSDPIRSEHYLTVTPKLAATSFLSVLICKHVIFNFKA